MPSAADVRAVVAEILERPPGSVSDADDLEALGWDSLADLNLIAIADQRFHSILDPKALAESERVGDLCTLLGAGA